MGSGHEDEFLGSIAVRRRRRDVRARAGLEQPGVERQRQPVRAHRSRIGMRNNSGACPVRGTLFVGLDAGATAGQQLEIGQRHPSSRMHLERMAGADRIRLLRRRHVAGVPLDELIGLLVQHQFMKPNWTNRAFLGWWPDRLLPERADLPRQRVHVQIDIPELDAAIRDESDQGSAHRRKVPL